MLITARCLDTEVPSRISRPSKNGNTERLPQIVTRDAARGQAGAPAGPMARSRPRDFRHSIAASKRTGRAVRRAPRPRAWLHLGALRITSPMAISPIIGTVADRSLPVIAPHRHGSVDGPCARRCDERVAAARPLSDGSRDLSGFVNVTANPDNPWQLPRPAAVIVAGLGPEGELRGTDLVNTVRQAVIGWAQRLTERSPVPAGFTLATTLLGSGGSGITAGQAAQLIAQGVREANETDRRGRRRQRSGRASTSSKSSNCTSTAQTKPGMRFRPSRRRPPPFTPSARPSRGESERCVGRRKPATVAPTMTLSAPLS